MDLVSFFLLTQWCHIYAVCYFILDVYSYFFYHTCLSKCDYVFYYYVCMILFQCLVTYLMYVNVRLSHN